MNFFRPSILIHLAIGAIPSLLAQDDWQPIGDSVSIIRYETIAYNGSQFLAAGLGTRFATSSDGIHWETGQTTTNQSLFGIDRIISTDLGWHAINRSQFGSSFMVAKDPSEWVTPEFTSSTQYLDIAHGNGFQVVLRFGGTVYKILDGSDVWPQHRLPRSGNAIAFGDGVFVVCGGFGSVSTSSDGVNWTARSTGVTSDLMRVIYSNREFVAVGHEGTILRSPKGADWEVLRMGGNERFRDIATFKDNYYLLSDDESQILRSDRFGNVQDLCLVEISAKGIAASADRIVIAGDEGLFLRTSDGERWHSNYGDRTGTGSDEYAFIEGKGVVARHLSRGLEFSTDLVGWRTSTPGGSTSQPFTHKSIFYRRNITDTKFYRSEDGGNWEPATDIPDLAGNITALISANDTLFAFENGKLLHVLNASSTWQTVDETIEGYASSLRYEGDVFILATEMTSPDLQSVDGLNWSNRSPPGDQAINTSYASFKDKHFTIINNRLNDSTDGDTWQPAEEDFFTQNNDPYYRFFEFERALFLADWKGNLYKTTNGESWTNYRVLIDDAFWIGNMIEFEGRILAIGARGQIYHQPSQSTLNLQAQIKSDLPIRIEAEYANPSRYGLYHEKSDDLVNWQGSLLIPEAGNQTVQAMLDPIQNSESNTQFHRIATGPSINYSGYWSGTLETEIAGGGSCSNPYPASERVSFLLNWFGDNRITMDQIKKEFIRENGVFEGTVDPVSLEVEWGRKVDSACQTLVDCDVSIKASLEPGLEMTISWTEELCGENGCVANRSLILYR